MSVNTASGCVLVDCAQQLLLVADQRHQLDLGGFGQQSGRPFPDEEIVLRENHPQRHAPTLDPGPNARQSAGMRSRNRSAPTSRVGSPVGGLGG